jgi:hypothetical protein
MDHTQTHELARKRVELSSIYARKSEQLGNILETKANIWLAFRDTTKSDSAANKLWEMTEEGIKEMRLKLDLKSIEK